MWLGAQFGKSIELAEGSQVLLLLDLFQEWQQKTILPPSLPAPGRIEGIDLEH